MSKSTADIFGSFFLGATEIAIEVEHIQEVVNFPDKLIRMPLAPDFMLGVFNLRGTIVPIIDVKKVLKLDSPSTLDTAKVAIIAYDGATIGLVFDSTSEILRSDSAERSDFHFNGRQDQVVKGALKLANGERIIQILDPKALVAIENIPQMQQNAASKGTTTTNKHTARKKCITFRVGDLALAFEINGIHEIVRVPEIQRSALESELCLGMVNIRGQIVPVISFATLLRKNREGTTDDTNARIIILKIGTEFFGLKVDSVESIDTFRADKLMPIPLLSKERAAMFSGCITVPDKGDVFLLNHQEVLNNEEVRDITHGHSKIYQEQKSAETKARSHKKQSYISFRVNHLFGLPIKEVREIINFSNEIVEAPGMPAFVKGILNLRGKLVTVIDTRALYDLTHQNDLDASQLRILVIERNNELYGLVVDNVENILAVDEQSKLQVPKFFVRDEQQSLQSDIKEIIEVPLGDKKTSLIVLNSSPLIDRIQGSKAA